MGKTKKKRRKLMRKTKYRALNYKKKTHKTRKKRGGSLGLTLGLLGGTFAAGIGLPYMFNKFKQKQEVKQAMIDGQEGEEQSVVWKNHENLAGSDMGGVDHRVVYDREDKFFNAGPYFSNTADVNKVRVGENNFYKHRTVEENINRMVQAVDQPPPTQHPPPPPTTHKSTPAPAPALPPAQPRPPTHSRTPARPAQPRPLQRAPHTRPTPNYMYQYPSNHYHRHHHYHH